MSKSSARFLLSCLLLLTRGNSIAQDLPYRNETLRSGVPFGGLGTGGFQVGVDGRISQATFNNNRSLPIGDMPGCFAAIRTERAGQASAFALCRPAPFGLPAPAEVRFGGGFPIGHWQFEDPALPVQARLRVFSPLAPGDPKSSSLPSALLIFMLENPGKEAVSVSVAVSWENLLGVGAGSAGRFSDRTGATIERLEPREGLFGLSFGGPPLPAIPPPDRLPYNARGDYALLTQATSEEWSVTTARWNALEPKPPWWDQFAQSGNIQGSTGEGREGALHPAGVICVRLPLAPGQREEVAFAVAWNAPRQYTLAGDDYGHYHSRSFSDAVAVGRYALENRLILETLTGEFQAALARSSLPGWLTRRLADEASVLATHSVLTRDSSLGGTDPGPALYGTLGSLRDTTTPLGGLSERRFVQPLLSAFYPALDAQELETLARSQLSDGGFRESFGSLRSGFPSADVPPRPGDGSESAAEGFLFCVLRHYQATGDQRFLDRLFPHAKRAADHVMSRPPSTTATLAIRRIAAIASVVKLAEGAGDRNFAFIAETHVDAQKKHLRERFWNGEFLCDSGAPGPIVDLAVLEGVAIAEALDLGEIVPEPERLATERALLKFAASAGGLVPPGKVNTRTGAAAERESRSAWVIGTLAPSLLRIDPAAAMETARRQMETLRKSAKSVWQPPTSIDFQSGAPLRDDLLPEAPSWNLLRAVLGFSVNVAEQRIVLRPVLPAGQKELRAPLFAAAFWGWLTYRTGADGSRLTLRLDRINARARAPRPSGDAAPTNLLPAVGLDVRQLVLPGAGGSFPSVTAAFGRAPAPGRLGTDAQGRPVFTFDPAIRLTPGREIELRWQTAS